MSKHSDGSKKRKPWPKNCPWPEPIRPGYGMAWEADDVDPMTVDADVSDLLDVKEYFDRQVEEGKLSTDYELTDQEPENEDDEMLEEVWTPEMGEEYWDENRFVLDAWEDDLSYQMNLLKIGVTDPDPIIAIREVLGYEFKNENLLRQAFTRRAFQEEFGLTGCNEELEFLGDAVLEMIITKEITEHLAQQTKERTDAPFELRKGISEGESSRIREHFVSRDHLAAKAHDLGLDQFILFGSGEVKTESACENALEALLGAVAIDSDWDWKTMEAVADNLLCIQLSAPDRFIQKTYYDIFNSWHQRKFGVMPEYELYCRTYSHGLLEAYDCSIRFQVPENDMDVRTMQRIDVKGETRSKARERAAELAYDFVKHHGLWIRLSDANVIPDYENSINQLQELYQKKYVEQPNYTFEELDKDFWRCDCNCNDVFGFGNAGSKTAAKKKASYMVLVKLLDAAGCCEPEWKNSMFDDIVS